MDLTAEDERRYKEINQGLWNAYENGKKDIFVSEDTGFQKPMKEFFEYVFDRIPNYIPEQGLIIGDSLSADIKGGQISGLDTCWFNPIRKENQSGFNPTFEIQQLKEIHEILPSLVKTL